MMIALLLLLLLRLWGVAIVDAPPVAAARHTFAATELIVAVPRSAQFFKFLSEGVSS